MWVISRVNILLYSTLSRFLLLEFLISSNWERATRTGVSYQPWNRGSLELRFFGKLFEAMFGFFRGENSLSSEGDSSIQWTTSCKTRPSGL